MPEREALWFATRQRKQLEPAVEWCQAGLLAAQKDQKAVQQQHVCPVEQPTAAQLAVLALRQAAAPVLLVVLQTAGPLLAVQPVHQVVAALVLLVVLQTAGPLVAAQAVLVVLQTAGPWVGVQTAQLVDGLLVAVLVAR